MGRSPVARKDKGKTTKHIHYMNTKQLLLSLLMSIMSVSAFAEDAVIDGINYSLNDETLEAEVARREEYSGDIIIPETVDYDGKTYSVTSIGIEAFYDCDGLTSITIPNSVTSIGERAFSYCYGLESIIVENGNTIYDSRENCNAIIETETNTLIVGCKNTVIPNSITIIGERAFSNCYGLTSITIPNSVTSIGEEAFSFCSGLTSVTIGNSVTSIGDNAFLACEGLTSVTIGNSVTTIGYYAFEGCESLTSVTIPSSVTSISRGVFSYCYGLESIIVENGNTIYDSRDNCNAIIETETNTLLQGCKNTVISGSVTSIGIGAFRNCVDLTSLTIPNSVTSIGEEALYGCTGLTSLTIPNSVTSIDIWAFNGCTGLTSVISMIEEPFEIFENVFSNYNATLYVPAGTKEKYEGTPAWNKFTNIVEGIENAVKSVETDAQAEETERYNVSGQRISSPQKGLNIVKMSDGTTRKIMCK